MYDVNHRTIEKKMFSFLFFFRRENANDSDDISEAKKNRPF